MKEKRDHLLEQEKMYPKLTIATTIYKSEGTITEFYLRCVEVLRQLDMASEILFIDDGSPDSSTEIITNLMLKDSRVRLIKLSRNFGHTPARIAAMNLARGELIYLIDSDLEESPEWILEFMTLLFTSKADVVFGVQTKRKGKLFERITGYCFYWLIKKFSSRVVITNQVTARLMTRRYVDALNKFSEKDIFLADLWDSVGFKQVSIQVKKLSRNKTTYTFSKKFEQAITALTSTSIKPIYIIAIIGFIASSIGIVVLTYLLGLILRGAPTLPGWVSVLASVWVFGGLILFAVSTIGLYISRIFVEVRDRPRYIVEDDSIKDL